MFNCPLPLRKYPFITIAHGGGGRLSKNLYDNLFYPIFGNSTASNAHDGAVMNISGGKIAITTDSYVVRPIFFPGGDIGKLSIYGSVNDLAMCGARPDYMSVAFILEEGLPIEHLWQIATSMRQAADEAGIRIITGDTKVVERGKGDGIYITTTAVGSVVSRTEISPRSIRENDVIILSGDIGRHGIAIISSREGLEFEAGIESDCAILWPDVKEILEAGIEAHCLRDLTRGGLSSALIELAESSGYRFEIMEESVALHPAVRGACEILGFDPMYVANEGRFVAFVPEEQVQKTLGILEKYKKSEYSPQVIGRVSGRDERGKVILKTRFGAARILDMISGEQLPRIC